MSGIVGVYSPKQENITDTLTYGLFATQNRGENSCGAGYSEESGIPLIDWITKNQGAPRTFLIEDPLARTLATRAKFNINPEVRGQRIGVSEDSIVRGTVIRTGTADKLKLMGAREVFALASYAHMPFRCYRAGRDEAMVAEGIQNLSVEDAGVKVARKIGIDGVLYIQ